VHLVAQMRVREMVLLGQEDGPSLIDQRFPQFKPWKILAPTCTDEVIIGIEGTVPRADLDLPSEVLMSLTFRSQRGERPLKYVKNGELTRSIGLHGIYRLSQSSATDLSALMESPPAAAPRIPRPGSDRRAMPAPGDALF
jgi:hypothetical protein